MNGTTLQARSMTTGQKREIRDLFHDTLDELGLTKEQAQQVLKHGGTLKAKIKGIFGELSASDLLDHITTVDIPEMTEPFVVNEHIQDEKTVGGVKWWLGSNFLQHFSGTTLPPCPAGKINIHKLNEGSVDSPIIAELGGEEVAETSLAQLHWMIMQQPHGEHGNLLANGYANIFYIRDTKGTLWAVDCRWYSDRRCWRVEASSVTYPDEWYDGYQVVSR